MLKARTILILTILLVSGACGGPAPTPANENSAFGVDLSAAAHKAARDGGRVALMDVEVGAWDRAIVFGPYAESADAARLLGFPWDLTTASPWTNSEGGYVVVLADFSKILAWTKVQSSDVELHCLAGKSFLREDAIFESESNGPDITLIPVNGVGCD